MRVAAKTVNNVREVVIGMVDHVREVKGADLHKPQLKIGLMTMMVSRSLPTRKKLVSVANLPSHPLVVVVAVHLLSPEVGAKTAISDFNLILVKYGLLQNSKLVHHYKSLLHKKSIIHQKHSLFIY